MLHTNIIAPTDIAVYIELEIAIVGPYDSIDTSGQILKEEPEAQESDTQVPALADETCQEYKK